MNMHMHMLQSCGGVLDERQGQRRPCQLCMYLNLYVNVYAYVFVHVYVYIYIYGAATRARVVPTTLHDRTPAPDPKA